MYTEPNHTINLQYLVGWRLDGGREENGLDDAWHGRRHDLATKKSSRLFILQGQYSLELLLMYLLRASVTISGNVDFQASIACHSDVVRFSISIGGYRPVDSNERKENSQPSNVLRIGISSLQELEEKVKAFRTINLNVKKKRYIISREDVLDSHENVLVKKGEDLDFSKVMLLHIPKPLLSALKHSMSTGMPVARIKYGFPPAAHTRFICSSR